LALKSKLKKQNITVKTFIFTWNYNSRYSRLFFSRKI